MAQTSQCIELQASQDESRELSDIQKPSVTQNKKWLCLIYFGLAIGLLMAVGAGLRPLVPAFTSQCEVVSNYGFCFTLWAMVIILAHLVLILADKSVVCCPEKWTRYKENCYYFSINRRTWERSSQQCVSHGSQMAVAEDEEVLMFLIGCCREHLTFWIGLNRKPEESWTWINGQLFDLNWKTQVQEESGDCAFVIKHSVQSKNCSTDLHWVCEKPLESCG